MATERGMAVNPGQYEGPRNAAGEPEGHGTFRANDGGTIYEGQYLNGKAEGRGTYCTEQGDIYEGEYKAGKEEGRGVFRFGHGGMYDGEWEAGKPHGRGTFVYPDGATYEGEYVKGHMQGPGTFYYPSGEADVGLFKDSVAWGEVARWTADRSDAAKLFMGKVVGPITLGQAEQIAKSIGLTAPPPRDVAPPPAPARPARAPPVRAGADAP